MFNTLKCQIKLHLEFTRSLRPSYEPSAYFAPNQVRVSIRPLVFVAFGLVHAVSWVSCFQLHALVL